MDLDGLLAQLEDAQLVHRGHDVEPTFQFKHSLTQEAAYGVLLKRDRVRLHRATAQTYEMLYADRLDEYAPIIAQQYAGADDDAKTLEYSVRAGDAAARIFASGESITHYSRALEIAKRSPAGQASFLRDLYIKRGRALELNGRNDLALENYADMEALAHERDNRAMELAALVARATIHSIPSAYLDPVRARTLSDRALVLARELGDQLAEAKILWNLMLLNARVDFHPLEAIRYGEQALAIARAFGVREQLAYILNDISMLYGMLGNPVQGHASASEARKLWVEFNNLPMLADNWSSTSFVHLLAGEYEPAIAASNEAHRISQSIGNVWGEAYSQTWIAPAYVALGKIDQAIQSMESAIHLGEHVFPVTLVISRADLARLHGDLGDVSNGIALGRLAYNQPQNMFWPFQARTAAALGHVYILAGELANAHEVIQRALEKFNPDDRCPFFDGPLYLAAAELALAEKDYVRADSLLGSTLAEQQGSNMRMLLPHTLYLKSQALRGLGRVDEARALLERARAEADELGDRWEPWRILAALAEMETDAAQAAALRGEARAHIQYIGEHTPLALFELFEKLPLVRAAQRNQ
jgi:tetratricopeptide (TPR) repeat protein